MSVEVKTTFKPTIDAASAWREETNLPKLNNNDGLWHKLFYLFQIQKLNKLWKIFQAVYGRCKYRLNFRLSFYNNLFFTYRVLMENLST